MHGGTTQTIQSRAQGGARGVGIILVSSPAEVDTPERPFQTRCRAPRAEDMPLGLPDMPLRVLPMSSDPIRKKIKLVG